MLHRRIVTVGCALALTACRSWQPVAGPPARALEQAQGRSLVARQ